MSFNQNTTDARAWAKEFVRTRETAAGKETADSMECWFATAILAGKRDAQNEAAEYAGSAIENINNGFIKKAIFSLLKITRTT